MLRSACSDLVGIPVEGPARMTSMTTMGISAAVASPSASIINERPGPDVAVSAGVPPKDAPMIMLIAASSSSACRRTPPTLGRLGASHSRISVAGRIECGEKRMGPTDILDVSGASATYLITGQPAGGNWTALFRPGERVRL